MEEKNYEERDKYSKEILENMKRYYKYSFELFKFVSSLYQSYFESYVERGPFKYFYDDHKIERSLEGIFGGDFEEWLKYYKKKYGNDNSHDSLCNLIMN